MEKTKGKFYISATLKMTLRYAQLFYFNSLFKQKQNFSIRHDQIESRILGSFFEKDFEYYFIVTKGEGFDCSKWGE